MKHIALKHGELCLLFGVVFKTKFNIYRGDEFRTEFSKIGELRNLIPSCVNIMALTATATLQVVTERLSLDNTIVNGLSPNQTHIFYDAEKLPDMVDYCKKLSANLMIQRQSFPKMLIFFLQLY